VRFYYQNSDPFPFFTHSPQLDSMVVFARSDLDKVIEKTKFSYGGTTTAEKSQLLQLIKYGTNRDEIQSYLFAYNPVSANPPIRTNDNRKDHWGYFSPNSNGRFSGKNYFGVSTGIGGPNSIYTDRYANNATATNGILSKITYPTAGISEFVWEPHSYSKLSREGVYAVQDRSFEDEISYHPQYAIETTLTLCGKSDNEILSISHTINSQRNILLNFSSYYPPIEWLHDYADCFGSWNEGNNFDQSTIGDRPHILVKRNGQVIQVIHICSATCQNPVVITASHG
jgi:hypothetical protein